MAGTVSSLVSLDASVTVTGVIAVPPSVTIPTAAVAPALSCVAVFTVKVIAANSSSSTVTVALPGVQFCTVAEIVALRLPLMRLSFGTVRVNKAVVCPIGIVTLAGT